MVSPTQADHNSWRSQYLEEKTLVTYNVWKQGLSVFEFLTKEQKIKNI